MYGKAQKTGTKATNEINMTPLIDVSLVLVVMLLLLTPLAFESSIAVRKAAASARESDRKEKEERIELKVVSNDSVMVNRAVVARCELESVLEPLLKKSVERRIVIDCSDDVYHGAFVDVLDRAKLCGAGDIAVLGR